MHRIIKQAKLFMKKNVPDNPRLIDIARLANVSLGTVDRVIHNRGRVSKDTRDRVNQAIESINYKPNVAAQILSLRKKRIVGVLVPGFNPGDYWEDVEKGIAKAEAEMADYGFIIERFHFDRHSIESFRNQIGHIKQREDIDGLVISPQYRKVSIEFAEYLKSQNIPFVFIDSNIEHSHQLSYFGMNSGKAGYILAKLMVDSLNADDDILIVNFHQAQNERTTQVSIIDSGFSDYITKNNHQGKLHRIDLLLVNPEWEKELSDYLKRYPRIKGAAVFNSLTFHLAQFVKENHISDIKIVGLDLIKRNTKYLREGYIKYLISQRPDSQGYQGVKSLCNYIAFSAVIPETNFMPIDIIIAENVEFFYV